MLKRKFAETQDVIDQIEDRAVRIKASRLKAKIDFGNKSLKTALDLARGFERQKLGRRQKQASSEPHTLLRLREEVIVLKELNIGETASNYLFKQLARTRRIKESPAFTALYGENPKVEPPKSNAESNVLGRLFKANPVKEVMPGILDGIKQVLNLDGDKTADAVGMRDTAKDSNKRQTEDQQKPSADSSEEFGGFSDEPVGENGVQTGSIDDNFDEANLDIYQGRLAGSSDEEDETPDELDPMEISDIESQEVEDTQSSISSALSDEGEDYKPHTPSGVNPVKQSSTAKATSTSFLPSLSMGGYYSGSESDNENYRDQNRGPALPKERKNRRGQRARQMIAELKFGKDAKHLQKQAKNRDTRNAGWDAKRGAVGSRAYDPKQRRFGKVSFARSKGLTGANNEAMVGDRTMKSMRPKAKKDNEGALHPSWEAAKKRKQETKQAAFAGKKITFD